ncbi:hypothetical protein J5U46_15835 [Micromonospora tulbaghiae]|uniref:Uncharacterized protein n=1 Tax=Micromonospora tulbaghiae TaxID=479978 RepID=A0AAW4JRS1_9ACTN|nr:hypothetical protein [Micromonospora tulbaghiae]MBO4141627.1 hypothetical protein [Micromonospora tulbaghiae]
MLCDTSRLRCLVRIVRRRWAHRAAPRPDRPEGCPERLDLDFLPYVWRYPRDSRPRVLAALSEHAPGCRCAVCAGTVTRPGSWPT